MSVEIDGVNNIIKADTISEVTSANGVAVDSLGIKDGKVTNLMNATLSAADLGTGVHIKIADSGATATAHGDELVIEDGTSGANVGISILCNANGEARINFGDSDDNDIGMIRYDHADNKLHLIANNTSVITLTSAEIVMNDGSADQDFRVESNDNAYQLFVDGGNNKIYTGAGSGNSIDNMHLQLQNQGLTVSSFAGDANSNEIHFIKSRNTTVGSSTVVADGDQIGSIIFQGDDGTDYATPGASIRAIVNGTPGGNDMPGALIFSTTADGAAAVTERVRIHNGGVMSASQGIALGVGINNTASNVLDDYEEGTYTPAFTVASGSLTVHSSHNTLAYTKIGRVVHVQGEIRFSAISSPSGNMSLNLPFAVADLAEGAARFTSAPIGQSSFSGTPNQTYYMRVTGEGVDTAFIATHNSGSDTGVNANQVSTSTEMIVSFTMIAA